MRLNNMKSIAITACPVGVSFCSEAVSRLKEGDILSFVHAPAFYGSGDNKKEYPNAIRVMHGTEQVGSLAESDLPMSPQQAVLRDIKSALSPTGIVTRIINPSEGDSFKSTFEFTVAVQDIMNIVFSFTEDTALEFDPVTHTYTHEGKVLTSASEWLKQFYLPFDSENIARMCAKTWGVSAGDIVKLWDSNRVLAADFGTAVHGAMEHYEKFRHIGAVIEANTGRPNPALPKHPLLKKIVQDFERVRIPGGETNSEVVLTDIKSGRCGTADQIVVLDREKKICSVRDFKVNIDVEAESKKSKPIGRFKGLPANKLTKYQLQMSYYADLLKEHGWTVNDLVAYVYEDEWKAYTMPVLNISVINWVGYIPEKMTPQELNSLTD